MQECPTVGYSLFHRLLDYVHEARYMQRPLVRELNPRLEMVHFNTINKLYYLSRAALMKV